VYGLGQIPACAGIGLRAPHHRDVVELQPTVGWLEAHSENYFADDGFAIDALLQARARYPVSLHGVGLSLGSTDPLDREHLAQLAILVRRTEPGLVSEHLSWSSVAGRHVNDLLPLPYTEEALRHICGRINAVQNELGRQLLIENVSSYLQFQCAELRESEFLSAVAAETSCGLLLDVNNVYVSAKNHGFDPLAFIQEIPRGAVQELHLAGHSATTIGCRQMLVDTHSAPVSEAVWKLYGAAIARFGNLPTLIEWDAAIPALDVLVAEAHKADRIMGTRLANAA
jgi:uncharacterized protein (UPF0276 family)